MKLQKRAREMQSLRGSPFRGFCVSHPSAVSLVRCRGQCAPIRSGSALLSWFFGFEWPPRSWFAPWLSFVAFVCPARMLSVIFGGY